MADLKVLCDSCLKSHDVTRVAMSSVGPLVIASPFMEGNVGECYQCMGCSRIYSEILGYFDFKKGEGMKRGRPFPRCNSDHLSPMYIKSRTSQGRAMFTCPQCGQEKDDAL